MSSGSTPGGDHRPGKRERSRADRRDALVRTALTTLGELGENATMEDLAAGMGVNKAALYRYFGNRANLHRALIGRWVSLSLSDFRSAVNAGPPAAEMIEHGFLSYLDALERERSTYLALTQLGHVAGRAGAQHLAAYISAAGDVVTEVMYSRFPGVPAGSELGRTWGQALAGMSHHVADRWARAPWHPRNRWRGRCSDSSSPRWKAASVTPPTVPSSPLPRRRAGRLPLRTCVVPELQHGVAVHAK